MADGQIVECDEHENEDLFWALRGAGCGNFGVVTSLVFRTVPAPPTTIFHLVWPFTRASELIQAWQDWAPAGPDDLDATLRLSVSGDGDRPPLVDLFGAVLGSDTDAAELLDEFIAGAGADPASASHRHVPYREAKRYLDGVGPADDWHEQAPPPPPPQANHLFTKSEFLRHPLPRETIAALVENLPRRLAGGQSCEVTFTPWGGAYNRVRADATAFVHRDESFLVQHLLILDPDVEPTSGGSPQDWLTRSWALVHPWGSGACIPTSRTRISRTGLTPTTGRTTTACYASRRNTTPTDSSGSTNPSLRDSFGPGKVLSTHHGPRPETGDPELADLGEAQDTHARGGPIR